MKPIDPAGFERLFRDAIDPWDYRSSPFEARKRHVLLQACGFGPYARGLELGCAIGETTPHLARLCLRLEALDASPTALDAARRRNAGEPRVRFRRAVLPDGLPPGPFDLIVISELVYYLSRRDLTRLMRGVAARLAPAGRVVLLHHLVPFADAAQPPVLAHAAARRALAGVARETCRLRTGRYEAVAFLGTRGRRGDLPGTLPKR